MIPDSGLDTVNPTPLLPGSEPLVFTEPLLPTPLSPIQDRPKLGGLDGDEEEEEEEEGMDTN